MFALSDTKKSRRKNLRVSTPAAAADNLLKEVASKTSDIAGDSNDLVFAQDQIVLRLYIEWTDLRCVGCSIKRFEVTRWRSIAVPITIRCIGFTNGKRICAC
jgi:hypothetical protein